MVLLSNHLTIAYGDPSNETALVNELGNETANLYKNKVLKTVNKLLWLVTLDISSPLEIESPFVKAKVEDAINYNCSDDIISKFNPLDYIYPSNDVARRVTVSAANITVKVKPKNVTAGKVWQMMNGKMKNGEFRCPKARVAQTYYANSNLFPNDTNAHQVVSINVTGNELDNFDSEAEVSFYNESRKRGVVSRNDTPLLNEVTEFVCGYWNRYDFPLKQYWQVQSDCRRVISADGFPRCHCKRPGSYNNLVIVVDLPADVVLESLSYAGCSVSMVGLVCVVFIYLAIGALRTRKTTPVLMHISVCMCLSYIAFIGTINLPHLEYVCYGGTIFLHYILLATWGWTCVNAMYMYRALVMVLAAEIERPILKGGILAYGMPAVVVATNASVTLLYFDNQLDKTSVLFESTYRRQNMCWLNTYSLYYGFLAPVGIMLLFNITMFYCVLRKLTWGRQQLQSTAGVQTAKDQLQITLLLVIMMGITWTIGYLMLISTDVLYLKIMSYLFTIFNVLQGLMLFLLNCVTKKAIRDMWMPKCDLRCLDEAQFTYCYRHSGSYDVTRFESRGTTLTLSTTAESTSTAGTSTAGRYSVQGF
ncbi:adhesion G-protein coupled receptor G7-like [Ciona intestinalis]